MCGTHHFGPVDDQRGLYNSAAHESLRAIGRCMLVNFGAEEGRRRLECAVYAMGVRNISQLSEFGANWTRKFIEKQLPLRGEFDPL